MLRRDFARASNVGRARIRSSDEGILDGARRLGKVASTREESRPAHRRGKTIFHWGSSLGSEVGDGSLMNAVG